MAVAMALIRRDVRAVEGGSLENCWGASPRGFESLSLRSLLHYYFYLGYFKYMFYSGEVRERSNRAPC